VTTEELDAAGNVVSVKTTETKTTLVSKNDSAFTLRVEDTVEVAGRRFPAEPKAVTLGFLGEVLDQTLRVSNLGQGEVTICGISYPCVIQQIVVTGERRRETTKTHYSVDVAPYVLQRKTRSTDEEGQSENYEAAVEVMAIDMPFKVLTQVKSVAFVRTVNRQGSGATTATVEVHCMDVPGAVVEHSSQERDASGRVVRRSTLALIDYESRRPAEAAPQLMKRRRIFPHLRPRNRD
jgi:hypothetical protein